MRASEVENAEVVGTGGTVLGTVEDVLFHPSEPRAVAYMVRPVALLGLVPRPSAYIPFASVRVEHGLARYEGAKLPGIGRAETSIGHHPETTVIWRGMPVRAKDGRVVGAVADIDLRLDGIVAGLLVSSGGVGDLAHGRAEVPGEYVKGFDGRVVALALAEDELVSSGGLVRKAAEGVGAASAKAGAAARAAGSAAADASYIAGRALRSAARSPGAKKARSALKGVADAFRSGYDSDDGKH